MLQRLATVLLPAILITAGARAASPPTVPFVIEYPADCRSPADVSFLLDAPAGKDGFIRPSGGHLVTPDGKRFRIWGVNLPVRGTVPEKANAAIIAANIARLGINCVRFHFLDRPAPDGIIDPNRDDTRSFDPVYIDRLDFFISELKKRGIYADLNLNAGRTY